MSKRQWIRFNDDSRAKRRREMYVTRNGGEFVKDVIGKGWHWRATSAPAPAPAPKPVVKKTVVKKTTKD
jgi:hypothetical protein